ncbi:flavin-containing monooxygenase [Mycolicibacterium thermoresistibile]|jgi:cation diffusion facilitator CzcD-associated flavoprotein CzcO|uniref:Monooxygenase n=2 Tax=Mycolicibacterium thermoresistibile TaxID=1797 RepID=G7CL85_MYCT3|nr:NAD(P)/FAD-dependent oxidoreductase [Mycolicibacterium thermoresistibile]EHI11161.1 monooxygenase [Mycolicibacterium thermoresistibile ATCC 19527]MCV7188570.1 NAD(P)/FAD-dependent oxidoreductase [Mycolicibacterium thermoresistibile]GAT16447.1 monooxygenase [Mycolicibacterium thermoresistibile]SNW17637.1 monooxygenase [Mycolicibacterium thermoresistibile]
MTVTGDVRPEYDVAIIGAGPGGIAAAHKLRRRGITDIAILERGDDFGGTWRDNHYPGLAVDIPILWYQFSFNRNPRWSRVFAPGPEIHRYLTDTARSLGLYPLLRPHHDVVGQRWNAENAMWQLTVRDRPPVTARFVISSVGGYVNARATDLEGLSDFTGKVLRPNCWDDGYDTRDKRVAVIGTGSSGAQIVSALSGRVARLDVYQRTPNWILPRPDFALPRALQRVLELPGVAAVLHNIGRAVFDLFFVVPIVHLMAHVPDRVLVRLLRGYDSLARFAFRVLLRAVVHDPQTRRRLMPAHGILAKRPIISGSYLPAFNDPRTHLITTPIERITAAGVRTTDGVERPVDLIVTATGYELWTDPETYFPGTILGDAGFDLALDYRENGLRSYGGTAHPRLPNRWEIVGPLAFVGVGWTDFVETMAEHAVRIIDAARRRGADVVTVTDEAFGRWDARMRKAGKAARLYYTRCNPGVNTYYVNSQRDTVYHRPQTITESLVFAHRPPLTDYRFERRPAAARSAVRALRHAEGNEAV